MNGAPAKPIRGVQVALPDGVDLAFELLDVTVEIVHRDLDGDGAVLAGDSLCLELLEFDLLGKTAATVCDLRQLGVHCGQFEK